MSFVGLNALFVKKNITKRGMGNTTLSIEEIKNLFCEWNTFHWKKFIAGQRDYRLVNG